MPRIDESRPFLPVNIAVLTVSDTRTLADDTSGNRLVELLQAAGHRLGDRAIVKDDVGQIVASLVSIQNKGGKLILCGVGSRVALVLRMANLHLALDIKEGGPGELIWG